MDQLHHWVNLCIIPAPFRIFLGIRRRWLNDVLSGFWRLNVWDMLVTTGQNRKLCVPYSLREAPQLSEPPATIDISYCNWLKRKCQKIDRNWHFQSWKWNYSFAQLDKFFLNPNSITIVTFVTITMNLKHCLYDHLYTLLLETCDIPVSLHLSVALASKLYF